MAGRRGRPRKEVTKDTIVRVRLTEEEAKELEYMSSKTGRSKSDILRDGLKYAHFNELMPDNK